MMKRFSMILMVALLIGATGCLKDSESSGCKNKTAASEAPAIQAYASGQGIPATPHGSGIYYQVLTPGTGATPTLTSKIFVTYTGKLLDGTTFDSGTTPAGGWLLSDLIQGWQIGIPLIQKGGTIKLIIPSSLAYGCSGRGAIPKDAILFFDITLNDVQ